MLTWLKFLHKAWKEMTETQQGGRNIDKIKKLGAGTPRKRCCEAPRKQPLQRYDYKGMHRFGEHKTKENVVVCFGQAQGLSIAGCPMDFSTVGRANQVHVR